MAHEHYMKIGMHQPDTRFISNYLSYSSKRPRHHLSCDRVMKEWSRLVVQVQVNKNKYRACIQNM